MESIKKYDLNKNDLSKLHFELKSAAPYFQKNIEKASKPHRHSFYQIVWFKEKGNHYIDYEIISHPKNTLFLINKNQVHHFCPESKNEGYLFHFNDDFVSKYGQDILDRFLVSIFNEVTKNHIILSDHEMFNFASITDHILSEMELKESNYKDIIFHHFQTILLYIEQIKKKQDDFDFKKNSDFSLIVRFKRLISERLNEFHNIDDYASSLNNSSKKLTSLSKQFLNNTPATVIKETKLLEAKRILSNQNTSIKEVGYLLGFDQATYFTKYFKKETGLTPKQFRESVLT